MKNAQILLSYLSKKENYQKPERFILTNDRRVNKINLKLSRLTIICRGLLNKSGSVILIFEKTNKITATKVGKVAVEVQARDFKILVDEPQESGGSDSGMNPVELLLCSLGACQVVAAAIFARQLKVDLEELWVELEGDMDSAGMMGYSGIRPGYQNIRFVFHIKTDSPPEKVQVLFDLVEQRCPVGDSLRNGVPFEKSKVILEY